MSHGHDHDHGHSHGHGCGELDHNLDSYTPAQRADLELVLAFNARFAAAIDEAVDTREVERFLDPDPMRYMWVDEGQGRIAGIIGEAEKLLADALPLPGHRRVAATRIAGSLRASRPAIATAPDGGRLCCWTEWVPDQGDLLRIVMPGPGADLAAAQPVDALAEPTDVYRPTAVVSTDGIGWVFFGRAANGPMQQGSHDVAVWGVRRVADGWSAPEQISTGEHPAFNQEATAHADGSVEICWQGRHEDRFAIYARTWHPDRGWDETRQVSPTDAGNVWDPAVASFADGSTAYAWSEYDEGSYRIVVRRRDGSGRLQPSRVVTTGHDYALHPSLAVTGDQALWCAFDLIVVAGHGGSGPTRLRPAEELGADPADVSGTKAPGDSVPSDLLPEISGRVEVVRVDEDSLSSPVGILGEALDVVPAGLPKLTALDGGGLAVTYRIHRRLPLMTYYWEVASQFLTSEGWSRPVTYSGSDGTLEEVGVAATADGLVVAAQSDARLAKALTWTEGFGGRECIYLTDHQGEVIWHSLQDVGSIALAEVTTPDPDGAAASWPMQLVRGSTVVADHREEARRWVGTDRGRHVAKVGDHEYRLYWGDLHRHSLVSRCTAGDEPNLEDFYRYAWDVCEYDFWAVTDHSENSSEYQWWSIQKIADLFHIPGRFVPFYGFEWTSPDTGHQNVIYGDVGRGAPIFSAFADGTTTPQGLWDGLAKHPEYPAITIPHHPGSAMVHNDWDYYHPEYTRLVEIFQACRGNYESNGAFRQYSDATALGTFTLDGLMRGHRFGLIASSDHGFGASYVGAYSESLERPAVFDALRSRRTFAATTRDVVVDVRMQTPDGTVFLGEETTADGPRTLRVHAHGYADLARVDIVRNGEVVHSVLPDLELPEDWVTVPLRLEWGGAHQVTVWDGELRVDGGRIVQTPYWSPEVVSADPASIAWRNSTRSFGELYGAQRGGIECTLVGPSSARVDVRAGGRTGAFTLGQLSSLTEPLPLPGSPGTFAVQLGTGGLTSLGASSIDFDWTDGATIEPAFYYVRVFQVDGEMAWSSPIWVTPHKGVTA